MSCRTRQLQFLCSLLLLPKQSSAFLAPASPLALHSSASAPNRIRRTSNSWALAVAAVRGGHLFRLTFDTYRPSNYDAPTQDAPSTSDNNGAVHNLPSTPPRVILEQEGSSSVYISWDEAKGKYVQVAGDGGSGASGKVGNGPVQQVSDMLRHALVPEDVTPDYYSFTQWRVFQRFVAGTISVLGTQALLLALGIKANKLGAAAAITWVTKDALGKLMRILWAGRMGKNFDSDAKRWRFRSSLLYAAGSGLEIVTYVFPALFLVLAASANGLKQVSMLTSSATRNTIYRSFALGENIGDITAKGEAQIAITDLLGMMGGVCLSKALGTSRLSIGIAYLLLSVLDIYAIYREIRSVVFTTLNYERAHLLAKEYVNAKLSGANGVINGHSTRLLSNVNASPPTIACRENIFRTARLKPSTFTTVRKAGFDGPRLEDALRTFRGEKYLLARGAQGNVSIVLHRAAGGADVLKSVLALAFLEAKLAEISAHSANTHPYVSWEQEISAMTSASAEASAVCGAFEAELRDLGWSTGKFMFGNIKSRSDWDVPLQVNGAQ